MSEVQFRSFSLERASLDDDGRTIEMQAIPWDTEAAIGPDVVESFDRHSFDAQLRAANRVPLTLGHPKPGMKITDTHIGRLTDMEARKSGLWVRARAATSTTARETMTLVNDGVLEEVSVGFIDMRTERENRDDGTRHMRRMAARLDHLAIVPAGNFGEKAKILAVREAAPRTTLAELRALATELG